MQHGDGGEWTFSPSLGRIAALGSTTEVVELYADLHDPAKAEDAARYVLASLCDQDDPTPLIGWNDADSMTVVRGAMPAGEQVVIARHLMQHGMVGQARPGATGTRSGNYSDSFDAVEYVGLARVHLGLSSADAEALSMTELQRLLELKFPETSQHRRLPSREAYTTAINAIEKARKGAQRGT